MIVGDSKMGVFARRDKALGACEVGLFKAKMKPRQLNGVVQPCRTSLRFQEGPSFR
jgi:hypothetical protein